MRRMDFELIENRQYRGRRAWAVGDTRVRHICLTFEINVFECEIAYLSVKLPTQLLYTLGASAGPRRLAYGEL